MNKLRRSPSIPQTILAILFEIGQGTIRSFFPHPYYHLFCHHKQRKSFNEALKRLEQNELIKKGGSDIFYLTRAGEKEALLAYVNAEISGKTWKKKREVAWDGKWRIIFFDVLGLKLLTQRVC